MSGALQAVFQNQRSFAAPPGQEAFTTAGTFSWVAPSGVTSVSVVAVGGGSSGAVNSPNTNGNAGGNSFFINTGTVKGGGGPAPNHCTCIATGGTFTGDGGGNGGGTTGTAGASGIIIVRYAA